MSEEILPCTFCGGSLNEYGVGCTNADCPSKRRASVQGCDGYLPFPDGTIAWWEHEEAWLAYAKRFGTEQSAERMHERGGFGLMELCSFLGRPPSTWRPASASVNYVMLRGVLDEKEGAK